VRIDSRDRRHSDPLGSTSCSSQCKSHCREAKPLSTGRPCTWMHGFKIDHGHIMHAKCYTIHFAVTSSPKEGMAAATFIRWKSHERECTYQWIYTEVRILSNCWLFSRFAIMLCWTACMIPYLQKLWIIYAGGSNSAGDDRMPICGSQPGSDNGWIVVGKAKSYTPSQLDVGHRLQLRVSVRAGLLSSFCLWKLLGKCGCTCWKLHHMKHLPKYRNLAVALACKALISGLCSGTFIISLSMITIRLCFKTYI
jgi:hypothetical protein